MKILATFDGSVSSESILPTLKLMAQMHAAEFTFLSIVAQPVLAGREGGEVAEVASADAQVALADRLEYLQGVIQQMPHGPAYSADARIAADPGSAIVQYALEHQPRIIVMSTHGVAGMVHLLVGDVAEEVVRSGVAPVLLVHPDAVRRRAEGADVVR